MAVKEVDLGLVTGPAGPQGPQGKTGQQGPTGAAGKAATIKIGKVTTGEEGSSAKVTNSGTENAAVLDITIPCGATGPQGPKERPEPLDRKAQPEKKGPPAQPDRQVHKESRESKDQKEQPEPPDRRVRKEQPGQQLVLKWELLRPGKREVRHPSQMQVQQVLPY